MAVKTEDEANPRAFWHLGGPGPGVKECGGTEVEVEAHGRSITTLFHSVVERVMLEKDGSLPWVPTKRHVFRKLNNFLKRFRNRAPVLEPAAVDDFLSHYSGRKRAVYEAAAEVYRALGGRIDKEYAHVKAFVKFEKLVKALAVPRLISPRDPVYILALGLYIKFAERVVCDVVTHIFGEVTITKGLNCYEVGQLVYEKFTSFKDPIAVGLDASRFDQHVSEPLLRFEHRCYMYLYANDPELARLLNMQINNYASAKCPDGFLRFNLKGGRMSGDINTGIGNCLIMTAMVWSFCDEVGLNAKLVNNGDDCVLFLEREDLGKLTTLPGWFQAMGFPMTIEDPVDTLEELEFCQCKPVYDGKRWRMVRNPHTSLVKDRFMMKNVSDSKTQSRLRDAIGMCGGAIAGDMPVYCSFYASMVDVNHRSGGEMDPNSGFFQMARGLITNFNKPTQEARYSFWLAFGITPDEQVELEERFACCLDTRREL